MTKIKLIVGLGNPGAEYAATRHNVGFWFIDLLADKFKSVLRTEGKFFAEVGKFRYEDNDVWLLKPQTFMNLSGKSILALASFYKILPNEILVVHDELDFAPGIAKLKLGGGAGGHNGLKSTESVISKDFWRLRLGIGHPGDKNKVSSFVLKKPLKDEEIEILNAMDRAAKIIPSLLSGEQNIAMKTLHTI
ncbi:MAG: aminoacyl-tRNA hydrolase [Burkholderiales bacterium]|nr:aminoacyl-tRNA hydrolase [Burkholderiales bacterium]